MLLTINNITVRYGKQTALEIQTPIHIEEGDRIGIIGSNGAGKTTLIKALLGLTNYEGSVQTLLKPEDMAVHMQFNHYPTTVSVRSIIEAITGRSIKQDSALQELITFFEFESCLSKRFSTLSGGQKQRLTIILVMLQNAPLTFFDEVTSGLDFESRQRLMDKLITWYSKKNTTLLVVSHYYEELEHLAKKILLLDQGKIIDFGTTEDLFQKYCGYSIITLDYCNENKLLLKDYKTLSAPSHMLAIPCKNKEEELALSHLLIKNNINFKRSNHDIEIMTINAKNYHQEHSEREAV